ncbi:MAG: TonB-dependent receptor [Bacteroidetes bacterium]|nr:TonB-dependent receptor [Bacteroidota bacterium]
MFTKLTKLLLVSLFMFSISAIAQQKTVTGSVSDSNGAPLPGVSVIVQGTQTGTQTDFDGNYSISVAPNQVLVFRYIGFKTVQRPVGNAVTINVTLEEDVQALSEVVIVGYGEKTRKSLTTSIASANVDEIRGIATSTVTGALQGSVTGLQVNQNSGVPGAGFSVRVRGSSSISGSNEPLYVVDGIPIVSGAVGDNGFGGQTNDILSSINFADVESIEVLKDASAAAIYGSRGANGVVLITTKRGKSGKVNVEVNSYYGFQEEIDRYDIMTAGEYFRFADTALAGFGIPAFASRGAFSGRNDFAAQGFTDPTDPAQLEAFYNSDFGDNFVDAVYKPGDIIVKQTDISISGGNEKATFYANFTDFNQEGVVFGQDFDRRSLRLNVDFKPTDKFNLDGGISITESDNRRINGDNNIFGLATAVLEAPGLTLRDEFGDFRSPTEFSFSNPLQNAIEDVSTSRTFRVLANIGLRYIINDNFNIYSRLSLDRLDFKESRNFSPNSAQGLGSNGEAFKEIDLINNWNGTTTLNYRQKFGDFDVSGLVGFSFEGVNQDSSELDTQNFPFGFTAVSNGSSIIQADNSITENKLFSYFGRAGLGYKDKLFFEGTIRADASSRFGEGEQIGYFPAFSGAYVISEEGWFKNNIVTNLKARASWGQTGNQSGIGNFASFFLTGSVDFAGTPGNAIVQLANPDLKWETTTQTNLGIDLTLWNKIDISYDYYFKDTEDLLLGRPLRNSSGFTAITENVGDMENKGHELSINARIFEGAFRWTSQFQISWNQNEVTGLVRDSNGEFVPIDTGFASRIAVGQSLGQFFGLKADGLYQTLDEIPAAVQARGIRPGDVKFVDLNGDGNIDANDRTFIGNPNPGAIGNFRNTFSWKGFDLTANLQFEIQKDIFNNTLGFAGASGSAAFNKLSSENDFWTPDNTDTDIPAPRFGAAQSFNNQDSDRFIEEGDYIRLKEIVLGYTLPKAWTGEDYSLRLYVGGDNLWTETDYSGLDPEVNTFGASNTSRGTDFFTQGLNKVVKIGLNLKF